MQDPGAVMLMVVVRDIDATLARLKQLGAPVVTRGGEPVTVGGRRCEQSWSRIRRGTSSSSCSSEECRRAAGATANIVGVRVRHTVAEPRALLALYRDGSGFGAARRFRRTSSDGRRARLARTRPRHEYRFTKLTVPTSGLAIELIEFKDTRRAPSPHASQDPGSTRIQLRVADIDAAVAALTQAGGTFISTGGKPLDLPAGNTTLKVGIVRDPDDLFLVLIQAPPAPC